MMRLFLSLIVSVAVLAGGAFAQTNGPSDEEYLCPPNNNLAELDMQILESDLTLEAALSATEGLKVWLPKYNKVNNWEPEMAVRNMLAIIEGYHLRQLVLNETDPFHRELDLTRFCAFMSKAIYID